MRKQQIQTVNISVLHMLYRFLGSTRRVTVDNMSVFKMKGTFFLVPCYLSFLYVVGHIFCGEVSSFQIFFRPPHKSRYLMSAHDTFGDDDHTEWGLSYQRNTKKCPITPVQVVNDVFRAIAGTLYDKQKPDPSIASNARSNSLYTHRPTRSSSADGRIGIEIDGAEFLFPSRTSAARAQRIFSLILAAKLSHGASWNEYEDQDDFTRSFRPVALSFNTIKEALLARQEMQILQNDCRTEKERDAFNHIIIQTLSDGLPKDLYIEKTKKRKHGRLKNLAVNATKGLLVVVQPTDFNQEFDPARPSLNSLNDFQKTMTSALIQHTPVVVISPRFLSYGETEAPDNEINQNGFQQASFYGGKEPPRGPAPFILRDL